MAYFSILFFSIASILSLLRDKSIKSLLFIFNAVWLLLIVISNIGYVGIDKASDEMYQLFTVGGISFNLFYYFASIVRFSISAKYGNIRRDNGYGEIEKYISIPLRNKISIVEVILLIYYIVKASELVALLAGGFSYSSIRGYYYSEQFLSSTFEYLAITYIIDPLVIVTELLFSISLFKPLFKRNTMFIMLAVVLLRTFVSGGRMVLFEFAIILFCCFMIFGKKNNIKFGKKLLYIVMIALFAVIAVLITTIRGTTEGTFLEKIYEMLVLNFTGSFTYLDTLIESNKFIDNTFGRTMFAGFIDPFIAIFRFIGLTNELTTQVEIGNITASFVEIGNYSYNAMPTMYYYFLTDFSYLGVILCPAVFGMIAAKTYKKMKSEQSCLSILLYIIMVLVIVESPMTWLLFKTQYAVAIIIVWMFFRSKRLPRLSEGTL